MKHTKRSEKIAHAVQGGILIGTVVAHFLRGIDEVTLVVVMVIVGLIEAVIQ